MTGGIGVLPPMAAARAGCTPYELPAELIIMHADGAPSLTAAFVFLRVSCGTGNPIWDVLPANRPLQQDGPWLTTSFGRKPGRAPAVHP